MNRAHGFLLWWTALLHRGTTVRRFPLGSLLSSFRLFGSLIDSGEERWW